MQGRGLRKNEKKFRTWSNDKLQPHFSGMIQSLYCKQTRLDMVPVKKNPVSYKNKFLDFFAAEKTKNLNERF